MAMTHLGSGIWSYRRRSTGAILRLTRPATIIRSDWRGEARMSSMPKRDMSLLGMTVLIISMAQQASPNSIGHMALVRPQLMARSSVVVTTPMLPSFCSKPMRASRSRGQAGRGGLVPLQRAALPNPDIADQQDANEHQHFDKTKYAQLAEGNRPGEKEDHFNIKEDKEHGHQVKPHRHAPHGRS